MLFSFSFQKLIVLAGIIAAVWYGFRVANRIKTERDRQGAFDQRKEARKAAAGSPSWRDRAKAAGRQAWGGSRRSAKAKPGADSAGRAEAIEAEEMVECSTCGAYVPAHGYKGVSRNCGRGDCPY
ncbi:MULTISPECIES: hypothetical protein [Limibacillus]|jgi:hypothetical protein|uniref:Uncharacterized protein n=1 Tax=Limibacillus halophilus TaxID=1579333 RepID=A0A839T195_9PROT|nr:hypothetical protein [Limibacillus halophilus]MBB3066913.1 hypothetical protein [Limibacillus halophilus]